MESPERVEQVPQDDWTDQDLLTRDEAAERLVEEMDIVTAELGRLDRSGAGTDAESPEVAQLTKRLAALRHAHAEMTRTDIS